MSDRQVYPMEQEMVNRGDKKNKNTINDNDNNENNDSTKNNFIYDISNRFINNDEDEDKSLIGKRTSSKLDISKTWRFIKKVFEGFLLCITLIKPLTIFILYCCYKPRNFSAKGFLNILLNRYDEKTIDIEIIEKYLYWKYFLNDAINFILRQFSSKLINTKKVRSDNIREHILQEQTEEHSSAKQAIIKVIKVKKQENNGKSRIRIGKGTLFGTVINDTDNKKLQEILRDARMINEELQKILGKEKDLYSFKVIENKEKKNRKEIDYPKSEYYFGYGVIDEETNKYFLENRKYFLEKVQVYYIFETTRTIYEKMIKFITNWFLAVMFLQNKGESKFDVNDLKFTIAFNTSIQSEWIVAAKYCIDNDKEKFKETMKDGVINSRDYDKLMDGLNKAIKAKKNQEDSFYIEDIKQFITTALTRKAGKSTSFLDQTVKEIKAEEKTMSCSEFFEKLKSTFNKVDNSHWTRHQYFSKEEMKEKWEKSAEEWNDIFFEKSSPTRQRSLSSSSKNLREIPKDKLASNDNNLSLEEESDIKPVGDEDLDWFFELLEDSRKYKWAFGIDKHFSEFTIDKVLIRQKDPVGGNIIHNAYLYKKYATFGRWLVEHYPTIAVEPFDDSVSYSLRLSAIKEGLYITNSDMPYTGETILHMTVIARNLEETRWLVDFYRFHEHHTNDGLKKLLMTAATGSFFHNDGEFYAGAYPIHFAVCCNDTDMFDLIVTYASNIKYGKDKKKLGSNIIFMRDQYGNNCLHLAVHHKLQEMYTHVLDSAKAFLKRDIKTAYAKQLSHGEKSNKIHNFPTLHDSMQQFVKDTAQEGTDFLFGYDKIEKPLQMPEESSPEAIDVWIQKQVKEKLNERFLHALNNDFHTPLTLCAQCEKCDDEDEEKEQKEMLEFLLNSEVYFKWQYGPLTCSAISLEGFDYPMTVEGKYKPLCRYDEYIVSSDTNKDKENPEYNKLLKKLINGRKMGVLDWICYRDRPLAAEIPIIEKYINLKWQRFANPIVNRSFYESLIIALAITLTCCFANASPTGDWETPAQLAVTVLYPIIGVMYLKIFLTECSLLFYYQGDYFGLRGGIRSSALFDKGARIVAMTTFLALCIAKIISVQLDEANVSKWLDDNETWASIDRPRESIPMALNAIFAWIYMYYFFMASDTYGSFIITISRIIGKDIPYFLSFYLIVVAAFSCALSTLTNSGDPAAIYGFRALIYCFWDLIQVTVGASDSINSDLNCTDIGNVPDGLQWFYSILITLFYMAVQIMMLNLLIGMIGNTYNQYSDSSKSLLLLEKYNVTCSMERYFDKKELNDQRKKYAIELNEDSDQKSVDTHNTHNNWAFDHIYFNKEWKNTKEEVQVTEESSSSIIKKLPEKIVLLIVMPQKDFHKGGSLAVEGADKDSQRIAELIRNEKNINRIDEIYVALDSHYRTHIAHAICWKHVKTECCFEEQCDDPEKCAIVWKQQIEKDGDPKYSVVKYKWKFYNEETEDGSSSKNYYLEEESFESKEHDGKINFSEKGFFKSKDEYEKHCGSKYEVLPFKKQVITKKQVKDDSTEKSVQYWYHPKPFQEILNNDLTSGLFEVVKNPNFDQEWAESYTKNLEKKNNYKLTIWPEHCIVGSSGHSVVDDLNDALQEWARKNQKSVQYIEKGQNCKTELYSILEAEVEDPEDPSTAFDSDLFSQLKIADRILICGQASSHCVKFTVTDLKRYWAEDDLSRIILLKDGSSPVFNYKTQAEEFISEMKDAGLTVINCEEVFAKIDEVQNKTAQQKVDEQQDKKIKEQEIRDKKQDEMLNNINTILENLSKSKSSM